MKIEIIYSNVKPMFDDEHWNYPVEELDHLFSQIEDGTRNDNAKFIYYGGRLYEV